MNKLLSNGKILLKTSAFLGFIYWVLKDIPWSSWKFPDIGLSQGVILIAITILFFPHLLWVSFLWKTSLKFLGQRIHWLKAWQICSIASLGRYIPGKVWLFVGKAAFAKKEGIKVSVAGSSMILELLGNVLGAGVVSIIGLSFTKTILDEGFYRFWIIIPILLSLYIFIHPKILFFFINRILIFLKKDTIPISFSFKDITTLIFSFSLDWIYQGLLFFILLYQFYSEIDFSLLPISIVIFTVSWLLGFFSFLTPGGLGVREGIMLILLSKIGVDKVSALNIAVISRIWMTLPEFITGGIFWFFNHQLNKLTKNE